MLFLCFMQSNTSYLFVKAYENYHSIWIKTKAGEDSRFLPFSYCKCRCQDNLQLWALLS